MSLREKKKGESRGTKKEGREEFEFESNILKKKFKVFLLLSHIYFTPIKGMSGRD